MYSVGNHSAKGRLRSPTLLLGVRTPRQKVGTKNTEKQEKRSNIYEINSNVPQRLGSWSCGNGGSTRKNLLPCSRSIRTK